jgi:hypothetical protein
MMNSIEPSLFPATPGNVKVIHGFQRDDAVLSLQQSSIKVQASLERPAYMSMSPFGTGRCTLEAFFPPHFNNGSKTTATPFSKTKTSI